MKPTRILELTDYSSSPDYWHNFVKYVRSTSDEAEWDSSEGGPGSYTYDRLDAVLLEEWKAVTNHNADYSATVVFPTVNHKLLFAIKYA